MRMHDLCSLNQLPTLDGGWLFLLLLLLPLLLLMLLVVAVAGDEAQH